MGDPDERRWFSVRCVFASRWISEQTGRSVFEERITLWRASSIEEAIARAEAEAETYAATIEEAPDTFLGLSQASAIEGALVDGAEVFSLMRESELEPQAYVDAFFDTGTERLRDL